MNSEMLISKIKTREARIGVIGLGYVGLPLVKEFLDSGFTVMGFDIDSQKVELLNQGKSYIKHISDDIIQDFRKKGRFKATIDFSQLKEVNAIIICVPTPLNEHRGPDLSHVISTTKIVANYLKKGQLIVLESTTYPGTTDEAMLPILESTSLKAGRDFFLAYSPEREDPGNKTYTTKNIPKIVGGVTPECLKVAKALYDKIVVKTVPVSSTRIAEASKLVENIYRAVNIALVNELKMLFDRMGIDIFEVLEAAKTKPFGFQVFYPGPGLGGHCIPIDPFYLTWKAKQYDFSTKFIELAGEINTNMPYYVVQKVMEALNQRRKSIKKAAILVLGVAYKRDIGDARESPSLKIMDLLLKKGAEVVYNDPYIPMCQGYRNYPRLGLKSIELTEDLLKSVDCVLLSTDHSAYNYQWIHQHSQLIIDTRNAFKEFTDGKIIKA